MRPTWPLLFASPSGNMLLAELSNMRGLSMELPATATTRAFCLCMAPALSAYTTPFTLPPASCSIRTTMLPGRTSSRPVASPRGISV